jgi:hypothetical protein
MGKLDVVDALEMLLQLHVLEQFRKGKRRARFSKFGSPQRPNFIQNFEARNF